MSVNTSECPTLMKATSNGVFQGESPLEHALPLVILQICLVVFVTRGLAFIFKPLKQPRVIAEIVGGVLLGPSALGRSEKYLHTIFPAKSLVVLDTLANLGLLFFLFLVGLELDPKALPRTGRNALAIAGAGITLPFLMGVGTSFILRETISKGVEGAPFVVFMGVALSITAFPVLARILAELKLLTTDVGRMAMSAAAINDVAAWVLLALAIALSGSGSSPLVTLWVFLSGGAFVAFCYIAVPPLFERMARRCVEGEPVKEVYVCVTLVSVLAAGFVTDLVGIHALFGAFVIGVVMPKDGPFASAVAEKVEDLVSGLFLPLYFVSSGLKTNVATISGPRSWAILALVIFTACFGKIAATLAVSVMCRVPFNEALALGFLMNTKGLVELIVLNIGKDRKVLNEETFAVMVVMALFTTFITTPLVIMVYNPGRRKMGGSGSDYKHRTVHRNDKSAQLRLLACFHGTHNIPALINLIEASRGGGGTPDGLLVYALHLMELSERHSAIRMVHKARKNGLPFWTKPRHPFSSAHTLVLDAFRHISRLSVRPMTAISSLSDIHDDICATAQKKRAAIIILPFHRHTVDYQWVNRRVLRHAPCSVGVLVDRGLTGGHGDILCKVTVMFFGGRDDMEALSYSVRMAENPRIVLTVVRLRGGVGTRR